MEPILRIARLLFLLFRRRVLVLMGTVLFGVFMILRLDFRGMLIGVGMVMKMPVGMGMSMLVGMDTLFVLMLMVMRMLMFMGMQVLEFR
jgi:hypothetical protein